jgi:hypothetical protein
MPSNVTGSDDTSPNDTGRDDTGRDDPDLWLAHAQADRAIAERRHRARARTWLVERPDETVSDLLAVHTEFGTWMVLELVGGRHVVGRCRLRGRDFAVIHTGAGHRWHLVRLAALAQIRTGGPIALPGVSGGVERGGDVVTVGATAWLADQMDERLEVMVWTGGTGVRGQVVACSDELLTLAGNDGSTTSLVWLAITDILEQ